MLPRPQAKLKDQQKTDNTKGRRAEAVVTALFPKKGGQMADSLLKVLAFNDEVKAVAMVATDAITVAQRRTTTLEFCNSSAWTYDHRNTIISK